MNDPALHVRSARRDVFSFFGRGLLLFLVFFGPLTWANGGFLQIRNGYFWDPLTTDYFIPHGMAYQTFNPPVGANQSFAQLEYDLIEFKKMYANSVRAEMVWNEVENPEGVFDWSKPDYLVAKAEALGLKLFVLVGFNYAPSWFPDDWKAVNDQGSNSVVLAYENPGVRQAYSNYIARVTSRYRNSPAIGAWILGNEYAYFDLWEPSRRYLGYDASSITSFRSYLSNHYGTVAAMNAAWGTNYASFAAVPMPRVYPSDRNNPVFHDLIQWRKKSIGEYVAIGSSAAKRADANHLRTYSMVGGLFGEADAHYTCEDARTIVQRCSVAGAPLDFWAINNYAIASFDTELRSADFGISKHQAASGLPVLISETGHTSTENLHPDAASRQGAALPSQLWEALMAGAMGVHVFTWNDRNLFYGGDFAREQGFGIALQNRLVKNPAYSNVVETFRRMEQLRLGRLLGGTTNPAPDIQLFWPAASDMGWPRANNEKIRLWSALKRLGYQPRIIHDEEFDAGLWAAAPALMLSRCFQLEPRHLDVIASNVVAAGIHIHASADFPGQFNPYHKPNSKWGQHMNRIFGLNVTNAVLDWDAGALDPCDIYRALNLAGVNGLGPLTNGYSDFALTWKIWRNLAVNAGTTIVTHTGLSGSSAPTPALHVHSPGPGKSAINTFALGDTSDTAISFCAPPGMPTHVPPHSWDTRYEWLRAIYRNHFGLTPALELSGAGASFIFPDYRFCTNGSVLVLLFNGHTNGASVVLTAPTLLGGRTVENLTSGGIIETNSDGVVTLNIAGDQTVLLYAYASAGGQDQSLQSIAPQKLWFEHAPSVIWPGDGGADLTVGFDTRVDTVTLRAALERVSPVSGILSTNATPVTVSGRSNAIVHLAVPDADPNNVDDISTPEGGRYVFHAWLEKAGARLSEVFLPVRLLWSVHPLSPLPAVSPGNTYQIALGWQELPSYLPAEYPTPLSRADLWENLQAALQHYDVVLELRGNGQVIASDHFLTSSGTDQHPFTVAVPANATGPFTWLAYLRPAPNSSHDLTDGFEERVPGSLQSFYQRDPNAISSLRPWTTYNYPINGTQQWLDEGVGTNASVGQYGAFLVVTNPTPPLGYSGFGLAYTYPATWSLPSVQSQWSNYTFSCDFLESLGHACILELQVKDDLGGVIAFTKPYTPGAGGWDTISASLDRFAVATNAPASGYFNQARVQTLVINVQLLDSNALYAANFDNIRLDGAESAPPAATSNDVVDSFEDRPQGDQENYLLPWQPYSYSEPGFSNAIIQARGIQPTASEGFRSVFLDVKNPANPGAYSGFGLYRDFAVPWALPGNTNQWTNYVFSFDLKEASGFRCVLELQVKSSANAWMSFSKNYAGSNQWNTIRASLKEFQRTPAGSGPFDPSHVQTLVLNVQMLDKNVTYHASIDNVRFDTPDVPDPPVLTYGVYRSENDALADSDRDGIPDLYETGTGIYLGPTNTGTDPNTPDTDGDGLSDRFEIIAGTNPNSAADTFRIRDLRRNTNGAVTLEWLALTNRTYSVSYLDGNLFEGALFCPVEGMNNITVVTNGLFQTIDPSAVGTVQRFYRIAVRNP